MRYSKRLQRKVDLLGKWYTPALIAEALKGAEEHARARGGREITPEDWDAALDAKYPDEPGIIGVDYVDALNMLLS